MEGSRSAPAMVLGWREVSLPDPTNSKRDPQIENAFVTRTNTEKDAYARSHAHARTRARAGDFRVSFEATVASKTGSGFYSRAWSHPPCLPPAASGCSLYQLTVDPRLQNSKEHEKEQSGCHLKTVFKTLLTLRTASRSVLRIG